VAAVATVADAGPPTACFHLAQQDLPIWIRHDDITEYAARVVFQLDAATRGDEYPDDAHQIGNCDSRHDDPPLAPRLTRTSHGAGLRTYRLTRNYAARYPSYDKLAIPALLYKPHGAAAGRKAPALVWVHGGPGGQSRVGYNPDVQFLVNHGYAILAVNNRGSSGYG